MNDFKIFQNPVLEKLSKTNPVIAIRTYIFISMVLMIYGISSVDVKMIQGLFSFILGLLSFTFLEYVAHRFLYHSGEDYKDEKNWQYKIHGVHHKFPRDEHILAMPIPLAILIASLFFLLFYFLLEVYVYSFFPGFLLGYAGYLYIHWKTHTRRPPKNMFRYLWKHHHIHHYLHEDKAYGVSSPLWDIIFNTMPPKEHIRKKKRSK